MDELILILTKNDSIIFVGEKQEKIYQMVIAKTKIYLAIKTN